MSENKYGVYIEGFTYGPFVTKVRGSFERTFKTKKAFEEAEDLLFRSRFFRNASIVDARTGSVLVANARILSVSLTKDSVEVKLAGGEL